MLEKARYTYRVLWSEEGQEYVGLCVEFPSLSWLALPPEEALEGIRQLAADVVADMQANGETPPTSLSTERYSGKFQSANERSPCLPADRQAGALAFEKHKEAETQGWPRKYKEANLTYTNALHGKCGLCRPYRSFPYRKHGPDVR